MKLVIKPSKDGKWYWVIASRNGKVFATSETYTRRASARRACKRYQAAHAQTALPPLEDDEEEPAPPAKKPAKQRK